jgi:hypothetical protein
MRKKAILAYMPLIKESDMSYLSDLETAAINGRFQGVQDISIDMIVRERQPSESIKTVRYADAVGISI